MNGLQFAALSIACIVLFLLYLKERNNMSVWPENKNPIISIFRENFDNGDKWGSNIRFLFGLCDIAMDYSVDIPSELEFSPSPFGSDGEAYEYQAIAGLLRDGVYVYEPLDLETFRKHVEHALKVLGRYDSLLRMNGENY